MSLVLAARTLFRGHVVSQHARAVALVREFTDGYDSEHIAYLIDHGIVIWGLIPRRLRSALIAWMVQNAGLLALSADERLKAAIEARPDCASTLETPEGALWLEQTFHW